MSVFRLQYLVNYQDLINAMQKNNQSRIGFGIYFGQLENPSLSDFEPPLATIIFLSTYFILFQTPNVFTVGASL